MSGNFAADFYGLPEFYVDAVRLENMTGTNTMRVYHWANRNGVMCPLYTSILATQKLVTLGGEVRDHALQTLARGQSH